EVQKCHISWVNAIHKEGVLLNVAYFFLPNYIDLSDVWHERYNYRSSQKLQAIFN
ncbi:hypothetical protein RG371_001902, partial [Acinetobacter baumannii]|nr:hypothetical protein [Acinetobacter baumannii]